ncbi:MAG: hypothetical protein P4N41_10005 [Negativicutes bacterium]|nr:hypothetical protein [Negativicutes bacterium]
MSGKNEPQPGTVEKNANGERDTTKLDQMIEAFIKKNPGKNTRKIHGGPYQS